MKTPKLTESFEKVIKNIPAEYKELTTIFPKKYRPQYDSLREMFEEEGITTVSMWIYLYSYLIIKRRWTEAEMYIADPVWKAFYKDNVIDRESR